MPTYFWLFILFHIVVQAEEIEFTKYSNKYNYADPDKIGYHHCAYWKLADGSHLHSTCDLFTHDRCGNKLEYFYKCCAGFKHVEIKKHGFDNVDHNTCGQIISPFENCLDAIKKIPNLSSFADKFSKIQEINFPKSDQPYTVFVPSTDDNDRKPFTASEHVVKGRFNIHDLQTGMKLETLDPKRQLYVSKKPHGIVSVDCVEIVDANLQYNSGFIHVLKKPLTVQNNPDQSNVFRLLESNEDTRDFAANLPESVKAELRQTDSWKRYTVLAPSKQAWSEIQNKYNQEKLQIIAANHVINNQYCSGDLIQKSKNYGSVQNESLELICSLDSAKKETHAIRSPLGDLSYFIQSDLSAANGVVHVINKTIVPLKIKTLRDVIVDDKAAESLQSKEFFKLLNECDLKMEQGKKYALILPQDNSFQWWSGYPDFRKEYDRFQNDQDYRCKVARYHIIQNDGRLDNINNFASHTLGHKTNNVDSNLYETTYFKNSAYGSQLNFHYSPISNMKFYMLGDVTIYLTSRINVPPEKNIIEILESTANTKVGHEKTVTAQLHENLFSIKNPNNLYLVTTDDGWKDPRASPLSKNPFRPEYTMYTDENLKNLHHIPLYLWGGDIGYFEKNTVNRFMSSVGIELIFWTDENGIMRIGYDGLNKSEWPKVVKTNMHGRDGMVWLIDGILKCPKPICVLKVKGNDHYDLYTAACQTIKLPNEDNVHDSFKAKPMVVSNKHPEYCITILQMSGEATELIDA